MRKLYAAPTVVHTTRMGVKWRVQAIGKVRKTLPIAPAGQPTPATETVLDALAQTATAAARALT